MRYTLRVHAMNERHLVDMLGHVRKQVRNPLAGLAVLLKLPQRLHESLFGSHRPRVRNFAWVVEIDHLTVATIKQRFRIERIDLTHSTLHKEEDDSLGFGSMMKPRNGKRRLSDGVSATPIREQRCGSERSKTACRLMEKVSSEQISSEHSGESKVGGDSSQNVHQYTSSREPVAMRETFSRLAQKVGCSQSKRNTFTPRNRKTD